MGFVLQRSELLLMHFLERLEPELKLGYLLYERIVFAFKSLIFGEQSLVGGFLLPEALNNMHILFLDD